MYTFYESYVKFINSIHFQVFNFTFESTKKLTMSVKKIVHCIISDKKIVQKTEITIKKEVKK